MIGRSVNLAFAAAVLIQTAAGAQESWTPPRRKGERNIQHMLFRLGGRP